MDGWWRWSRVVSVRWKPGAGGSWIFVVWMKEGTVQGKAMAGERVEGLGEKGQGPVGAGRRSEGAGG